MWELQISFNAIFPRYVGLCTVQVHRDIGTRTLIALGLTVAGDGDVVFEHIYIFYPLFFLLYDLNFVSESIERS